MCNSFLCKTIFHSQFDSSVFVFSLVDGDFILYTRLSITHTQAEIEQFICRAILCLREISVALNSLFRTHFILAAESGNLNGERGCSQGNEVRWSLMIVAFSSLSPSELQLCWKWIIVTTRHRRDPINTEEKNVQHAITQVESSSIWFVI